MGRFAVNTRLFLSFFTLLFLCGCLGTKPSVSQDSTQFRLQSLESEVQSLKEELERQRRELAQAEASLGSKSGHKPKVPVPAQAATTPPDRVPIDKPKPFARSTASSAEQKSSTSSESNVGRVPPAPSSIAPTSASSEKSSTPFSRSTTATQSVIPVPTPAAPADVTSAKPVTQATNAVFASPAPKGAASEDEMYNKALKAVMNGKTEIARKEFNSFLEAYPQSTLAPNAYYWIGESYYHDNNYAQSILSFKEVTAKYPQHHKTADALYKIGLAYEKMGDKQNALFYYRMLVDNHPGSNLRQAAKGKVSSLSTN